MPRFRRISLLASSAAAATLLVVPLLAINKKNAGPTEFELKFKLPPPTPLSPEEERKTFKLEPGFRIELVASEPMIECPIAISFDDQGRLYVVEMRGYMRDVEAAPSRNRRVASRSWKTPMAMAAWTSRVCSSTNSSCRAP